MTDRRRIPIVATILVLLAVGLMVRLGLWQLDRRHEKAAMLAHYAANANRPPAPLAALFAVGEDDLYRQVSGYCLEVTRWQIRAGRDQAGNGGWRHVAECRTGAKVPGFAVDMGVSASADAPRWSGGPVRGRLILSREPALPGMGKAAPAMAMIVSTEPAPSLSASASPNPANLPNNHLAYAVQWFAFAAVALLIYALALWRRGRLVAPGPAGR
ncbi:SURF1 family protein [uncultured Sphingomonas sp.]|uniref:SURF1 family protein n=1 Tax=uncultured Sphingomonas sp. TaxID=158754 RepID=UPI0025F1C805|nr:SURF1 family protein [uncultured Sphingomonas sp.]